MWMGGGGDGEGRGGGLSAKKERKSVILGEKNTLLVA